VLTSRPSIPVAEALGRELATLHAAGAPAFGAPPPGGPRDAWIGPVPMVNDPGPNWPDWYAHCRVLPYLRSVRNDGLISEAEVATLERVCARLAELVPPITSPARLHGDLWNGNVLWGADGHPWLIDPAAHGGHPETDLAMLHLFGCPHLDRVLAGYQEVAPLEDGWRERIGLHQLFPLLVHAIQYGRGYAQQALDVAQAWR
jgi:fructosamine-3-kinase